jgi:hypothetical protein
MRQTQIAGEKLFVDFAGRTGEVPQEPIVLDKQLSRNELVK